MWIGKEQEEEEERVVVLALVQKRLKSGANL